MCVPNAASRWATSCPMRPSPTTPTVLPKISVPENDDRFQVCSRSDASAGGDLARGGQHQRERVLGGAVDVRRRRVDHQHAAGGGGVDVDVVQADTCARDDLQLGRGGQHLGVDGGRGADQQRVGLGHGGQQLFAVGAVDPADLYLVTERGDSGFGQFVGNQYDGKTHAASLMGLNWGGAGESAWT